MPYLNNTLKRLYSLFLGARVSVLKKPFSVFSSKGPTLFSVSVVTEGIPVFLLNQPSPFLSFKIMLQL